MIFSKKLVKPYNSLPLVTFEMVIEFLVKIFVCLACLDSQTLRPVVSVFVISLSWARNCLSLVDRVK